MSAISLFAPFKVLQPRFSMILCDHINRSDRAATERYGESLI